MAATLNPARLALAAAASSAVAVHHRNWIRVFVAVAVVVGLLTVSPLGAQTASAFGTTVSQGSEHALITMAGLGCFPLGSASDGQCFEQGSLEAVAGTPADPYSGAVSTPDNLATGLPLVPQPHCDDADYLNSGSYPQTIDDRDSALFECMQELQGDLKLAIASAGYMLDSQGNLDTSQLGTPPLDSPNMCAITTAAVLDFSGAESAKCDTLLAFGQLLHGAEDFYSHSNWVDAPTGGNTITDPPGLDQNGQLFPPLGFSSGDYTIPTDLTTGCFFWVDPLENLPATVLVASFTAMSIRMTARSLLEVMGGGLPRVLDLIPVVPGVV